MKSSILGMYISKVDIEFLKYLHSVKVASYEQASRDIYHGLKSNSVAKRLRKLENNKLIEGYRSRTIRHGKKVVSLTKKGFSEFVAKGEEQRIEIKSDSVEHDLSLVDIRHRFLQRPKIKRYICENELQTWGKSHDDGIYSAFMNLNSDGLVVAEGAENLLFLPIEFDAYHKSNSRYEQFFEKYYSSSEVTIALYVCNSKRIMTQLMKVEEQKANTVHPKFFYILKNDLFENDEFVFKNWKGQQIKL